MVKYETGGAAPRFRKTALFLRFLLITAIIALIMVLADMVFGNVFWGRRYTPLASGMFSENMLVALYGLCMDISAALAALILTFLSKKRNTGKAPPTPKKIMWGKIGLAALGLAIVLDIIGWFTRLLISPIRLLATTTAYVLEISFTWLNGGEILGSSPMYPLLTSMLIYGAFILLGWLLYLAFSFILRLRATGKSGEELAGPVADTVPGAAHIGLTLENLPESGDERPVGDKAVREQKKGLFDVKRGAALVALTAVILLPAVLLGDLFINSNLYYTLMDKGLHTNFMVMLAMDIICLALAGALVLAQRKKLGSLPPMPREVAIIAKILSVIFLGLALLIALGHVVSIFNPGMQTSLFQYIPNIFLTLSNAVSFIVNLVLSFLCGGTIRPGSPFDLFVFYLGELLPWLFITLGVYFAFRTIYRLTSAKGQSVEPSLALEGENLNSAEGIAENQQDLKSAMAESLEPAGGAQPTGSEGAESAPSAEADTISAEAEILEAGALKPPADNISHEGGVEGGLPKGGELEQ